MDRSLLQNTEPTIVALIFDKLPVVVLVCVDCVSLSPHSCACLSLPRPRCHHKIDKLDKLNNDKLDKSNNLGKLVWSNRTCCYTLHDLTTRQLCQNNAGTMRTSNTGATWHHLQIVDNTVGISHRHRIVPSAQLPRSSFVSEWLLLSWLECSVVKMLIICVACRIISEKWKEMQRNLILLRVGLCRVCGRFRPVKSGLDFQFWWNFKSSAIWYKCELCRVMFLILGELGCHMSNAHGLRLGQPRGGLDSRSRWEQQQHGRTCVFPTDICLNLKYDIFSKLYEAVWEKWNGANFNLIRWPLRQCFSPWHAHTPRTCPAGGAYQILSQKRIFAYNARFMNQNNFYVRFFTSEH